MKCSHVRIEGADYPGQHCSRLPIRSDTLGRRWCTYHYKRLSDGARVGLRPENKHTPGPWSVSGRDVVSEDAYPVATVTKRRLTTEGNALLIAAAPDLYKAAAFLRDARTLSDDGSEVTISRQSFDELMAAIAKAEGR